MSGLLAHGGRHRRQDGRVRHDHRQHHCDLGLDQLDRRIAELELRVGE